MKQVLLACVWAVAGLIAPAMAQPAPGSATLPGPLPGAGPLAGSLPGAGVVKVEASWSHESASVGATVTLGVVFDIEPGWHINVAADQLPQSANFLIPTTVEVVDAPAGITIGPAMFGPAQTVEVNDTGQPTPLAVYEGRTVVRLPVTVSAAGVSAGGEAWLNVQVSYQACNDQTCLRPVTQTLAVALKISAVEGSVIDEQLLVADEPVSRLAGASGSKGVLTIGGVGWVLLLAFIGGALLNVMPCVLPVIPIKILGLVKAEPRYGRRLVLGGAMALGVLGFWVGLGLVLALAASDQKAISVLFGYWWFNVGLGLFIIVMAVGMCGLFVIGLPRWVYAIHPRHDSVVGAFGFGVMTGVLGTPCTGPFLGGAAATVLGAGPGMAAMVFASIGLGMAIPYFVLTAWPALVDRLPRSGPAGELVKQVLGLLMIGGGVFFVGAGLNALRNDGTAYVYPWHWWAAASVIVGACGWMVARTFRITLNGKRRLGFTVLGVVAALGTGGFAALATQPSEIAWVYYTPDRLAQARAKGNVVVLDFTADWCINCKALELKELETRPVIAALADAKVTAMKVDLTSNESAGWKLLEEQGRAAIPLLVVLSPSGEAVFKQELYTAAQVVEAIRAAGG